MISIREYLHTVKGRIRLLLACAWVLECLLFIENATLTFYEKCYTKLWIRHWNKTLVEQQSVHQRGLMVWQIRPILEIDLRKYLYFCHDLRKKNCQGEKKNCCFFIQLSVFKHFCSFMLKTLVLLLQKALWNAILRSVMVIVLMSFFNLEKLTVNELGEKQR